MRATVLDCLFSKSGLLCTLELIKNAGFWVPPQVCWISIAECGTWEWALATDFLEWGGVLLKAQM